ncbi:MAG: hypothetical protein AAGH99_11335 [Planctomycetota bacterium]
MDLNAEHLDLVELARAFLRELHETGEPLRPILNTGYVSESWVQRYVAFTDRVAAEFGESDPLPGEILAVIYCASVYCTKRYYDWQMLSGRKGVASDPSDIKKIRRAGDRILLRPFYEGLT